MRGRHSASNRLMGVPARGAWALLSACPARSAGALLLLAWAVLAAACSRAPKAPEPEPQEVVWCDCELRSWVVAGRGRHLYLLINCPPPYEHLSTRVEYTTTRLRSDYDGRGVPAAQRERIARMTPGEILRPLLQAPDNRLEASFRVTLDTALCLMRDRMFEGGYFLVGTNSSSGLRRAMEDCGCELPAHVLSGGGVLGEFPGIDQDPGEEVPGEQWKLYGMDGGPVGVAEPAGT